MVKVIRLPLDRAAKLLIQFNNLRLVYLVRDPRATLHSRREMKWQTDGQEFCQQLAQAHHQAVELQNEFKDRFTILRYEDLAEDPVVTARQLFQWLRLPWLPQVDDFIAQHSSSDSDGVYSTYRRKGSRIASWVNQTHWNDVKHLQNVCGNVLQLFGYLKIRNRSLKLKAGFNETVDANNKVMCNYCTSAK